MQTDASRTVVQEVIQHHLRIMGLGECSQILILSKPDYSEVAGVLNGMSSGSVCVALQPTSSFAMAFEVAMVERMEKPPECFTFSVQTKAVGKKKLRSLYTANAFHHVAGTPVVLDKHGQAIWLWLPFGAGGILFIGSDLASDLIRYRQGDQSRAGERPSETLWGIPGERPNYLFDEQLSGESLTDRHADYWAMALASFLSERLAKPLNHILPNGAAGAVVITGDDDQAYLEKYDEQLKLLGDIPITYLLHPLTRHTQKTLRAMRKRNPGVDFGIHPDALATPDRYSELFDEQVAWFRRLTGTGPISLRNHGYLNDGYWGHLPAWLKHGVRISSNLPGFDGRVLNGSLLPARMAWNGALTPHWSILTVIGDGVRFASAMSDEDAAERVRSVADGIRQSGIPGVMVLNLHPQNVAETRAMHHAVVEIIRSGFVAWNLRQCLEWFEQIDSGIPTESTRSQASWFSRQWRRLREGRLTIMDATA
jgi:hypothetical protein